MFQSTSKGPIKNNGNGAQKVCMVRLVPPRGTLNTKGAPSKSIPAMEQLNIQEYLNKAY